MKENYFIELKKKSFEFLKIIKNPPHYRKRCFAINSAALLVIDMQNYFLESASHAYIPAASSIVNNVNSLITFFNKENRPVILTRHINTIENSGMMSIWWKDIITENKYGEISESVEAKRNKIITKTQYDSFYGTELGKELKENQIRQVVICGLTAHLCCESTARSAFIRGFEVFFPVDATATFREELHISTLKNLSDGFAHIVSTNEITNAEQNK